jgi:nitronate monooxygenase
MWPDTRIIDLFGITHPIIQAPMAGACGSGLAIAVSETGGLGSLPCATLDGDHMRAEMGTIRQQTTKPYNVNFFCHEPAKIDVTRDDDWRTLLAPYYDELGISDGPASKVDLVPFTEEACQILEELKPAVVSFHFGLPDATQMNRIKAVGCKVISSANTAAEARWLEERGCDAIIAQGTEAGGHRGMFLSKDVSEQAGTMALVPQVVDAVNIPVIAAGGIADGRGIAAAFALGASGVQMGTAFLSTPESLVSDKHRTALSTAADDQMVLTNVLTGRVARAFNSRLIRDVGPITNAAPDFPTATGALLPLRAKAEPEGSVDFTSLLAGQSAGLNREMGAADLLATLVDETAVQFAKLSKN